MSRGGRCLRLWRAGTLRGAGEKDPVAAVVPKDHRTFDPQSLFQACRRRLESNFVPRFVQVLEQIPKTASEKPQEHFLIEAFETSRTESSPNCAPSRRDTHFAN